MPVVEDTTVHEQPAPAALLAYGVEPRSKHWRRWAGFVLAGLVLFVAAWVVVRVGRVFRAQSAHLRAQAALFRQALPAGTVIYTEDPRRIEALRAQGGYRDARTSRWHGAEDVAVMPDAWERVQQNWFFEARDDGSAEVGNFQIDDTFNHRRTSKGGVEWIVSLSDGGPFKARDGARVAGITHGVFSLAGWKPGDRGAHRSAMNENVFLERSDVFTLFAPQADPNDPSLVNVPYELNGQPGVIDAEVTDKGRIRCTVRTGPARLVGWDRQNETWQRPTAGRR